MTQSSKGNSCLPEFLRAYQFACECFGVTRAHNSKSSDPTGKMRQRLHRFFNPRNRSRNENTRQELDERLYGAFRRYRPNDFGHAYAVADEATLALLSIYRDLSPRLDTKGLSSPEAMWVLTEHVLMP